MAPSSTLPDALGEGLHMRVHGGPELPTLIYLPGLHGDWTLITLFRKAMKGRVRFVEFIYPRTLTWSLGEYADAIEAKLLEQGITRGWLLGESFGSQVLWPLVAPGRRFRADGIILAGGFIKHPFTWGVRGARAFCHGVSLAWLTRLMFFYARLARFRYRDVPELKASLEEFIARRTELDKQAAAHRLQLIATHDPRKIAAQTAVPIFYLTGLVDPVVAWPCVWLWLKKHCPAFCGARVFWRADHNVLGTAPVATAAQILAWMQAKT